MLPVLHIGPLALPSAPLALLLGVWAGAWLAERAAPRGQAEAVSTLAMLMLAAGLVCARLAYAARFLAIYAADPLSLLSPNPASLDLWAGLAGAALGGLAYGWRRGLRLWPTLDALAPGLALLAVAVGLAHLASGDAFGAPANLPWSIWLWEAWRHPTQLYELIAAGLVLVVWRLARGRSPFDGFGFLLVLALTAAARLLLEGFRGDSWLVLGGLRGAQLVALALLLAALALLRQRALADG